ncbi:hypothetical protein BD413DRAFT_614345 [Trametes elegans]|nr:hypothetical protein BD413DRAFT_614345 [Trametes elegans]
MEPKDHENLRGIHPVLDYDILTAVMSVSCRDTASKLMRTCWTLYHAGARYILDGGVNIGDNFVGSLMPSLSMFLVAEDGQRLQYLRCLRIGRISQPLDPDFVSLLARASHLEYIIILHAENLLTSNPTFGHMISQELLSLRRLNLNRAGEKTVEVLRQMRAPLVSLVISFVDIREFSSNSQGQEQQPWYPAVFCAKLATSLQTLRITPEILDEPFGGSMTYPKLHNLLLLDNAPLTRSYIQACPSLRDLGVLTMRQPWDAEDEQNFPEPAAIRRRNMEDQVSLGTWPGLEEFSGNVAALYLFGLTCPVRRIVFEIVEDWSFPLLAPAIGQTRPKYLELWLSCEQLSEYRASYLTDALKSPGAASLEQLDLRLCIQNHDLDEEVHTVLGMLRDTLIHMQLKSLRLGLYPAQSLDPYRPYSYYYHDTSLTTDQLRELPLLPIELLLREYDFERYAQEVFAGTPSLKHAQLAVEGPRHEQVRIVHVDRSEGGDIVVRKQHKKYPHAIDGAFEWA